MLNKNFWVRSALLTAIFTAGALVNAAQAGAREEGRLLTATEVLEEVKAMPDVKLPDKLLAHAYGIAVIPDVTKVAFIFGGRHGNGVLSVRDKLTSPWSNPVFVSLNGGSWGFQAGAQSFAQVMFFTTNEAIAYLDKSDGWSVGVGPSIVVMDQGMAKTATSQTLSSDVYVFIFGQRGLMGGAGVQGQKITRIGN